MPINTTYLSSDALLSCVCPSLGAREQTCLVQPCASLVFKYQADTCPYNLAKNRKQTLPWLRNQINVFSSAPSSESWKAAYFRVTACVPLENVPYYQLTMYDTNAAVFNVYQCPDRFCNECVGVVKPHQFPANECTNNYFVSLYP
jgi:hypothetical protein